MKRVLYQAGLCVAAVLSPFVAGCDESSDLTAGRGARQMSATPGPEESFDLILETFRRGVEGAKIGFVAQREGGRSMMSGENKVSHELVRPARKGDPYKAIITVHSQSYYSLQRTTSPDDSDHENSGKQDRRSDIAGADDPVNIDILDPDLVGSPTGGGSRRRPSQKDGTTVARMPPTPVTKSYELQYQNGRWNLTSKLDPETEQGIANAFKHALKTQI